MSLASKNIEEFESLLVTLQDSLGVVVPDNQRGDLTERIKPLLSAHQLDSLASLAASIQGDQADKIKSEILDAISHSVSTWDLNPEIKDILHDYVFPELPDNARIWIMDCGQGQLAYSVAMEVAEFEHATRKCRNFRLIATDVSQDNIRHAELATYSKQQLSGLSEEYKKLFITLDDDASGGKVKEKIRQLISFIQCDMTVDFQSLETVDLIICQESLVYFSNDTKANIVQRLSELLNSGGIFLVGNSQTMSSGNGLERVQHPAGVFYRRKD